MNRILLTIGAIIVALGVKMIYDARPIAKTYFGFGQENEAVIRTENTRIYINHSRRFFVVLQF